MNNTRQDIRGKRRGALIALGAALAAVALGLSASTGSASSLVGTWSLTASMSTPRVYHTATLLQDGKVLVAGGRNASEAALASSELFNPVTGQWTTTGNLNVARDQASAVLLPNGKVLIAGGEAAAYQDLTSAELYDPATGTWSLTGSMQETRVDFEMQTLPDGTVLAAGGQRQNTYGVTATAERYNPRSGTWSGVGSMHHTRGAPQSALLQNGHVLVSGGCQYGGCPGPIAPAGELFDPSTHTWTLASDPVEPRMQTEMVSLSDGRIFIAGGTSYAGGYWHPTSAVEAYNPAADQWSLLSPLGSPTENLLSAALPDSRVVVAGGANSYGQRLATSQLYDPTSDTWQSTGGLAVPRMLTTTVTLTDGRVLTTGGRGYSSTALSSAEIFTLDADTTAPVITAPATVSADATTPSGAVVTYQVTATDNVDGPVPVTCVPPSGSLFAIGNKTVECTAKDAAGNVAEASFTVHVKGAAEQMVDAMGDVAALSPPATAQTKNGLNWMLNRALQALSANDKQTACVTLGTYVYQVYQSMRPPAKLLAQEGLHLIQDARRVQAVIGC